MLNCSLGERYCHLFSPNIIYTGLFSGLSGGGGGDMYKLHLYSSEVAVRISHFHKFKGATTPDSFSSVESH